jgi:ribonuclease-3
LTKQQAQLVQKLGIVFQHEALLTQSLTHRSVGAVNNERLEYLGDAILSFVIAEALFQQFPKVKEGKLSRLRASLVQGTTLAEIARELDLGGYLILGPGELKSGGFRRESILADAVEAIIGAYYLDSGLEPVKGLILDLFGERLQSIDIDENIKDPKTKLQEYLQGKKQPLPIYSVKEIRTSGNNPVFEASCQVNNLNKVVVAQGGSHRKAEQEAATLALKMLNEA